MSGKNIMPEIAKLLGVEINEEFYIKDATGKDDDLHRFTSETFEYYDQSMGEWCETLRFVDLVCGLAEIVKKPFEPKRGEEFYKVCVGGGKLTTCVEMWADYLVDYALKYCGNCFRTQEDAEKHKYEIYEKLTGEKWKE